MSDTVWIAEIKGYEEDDNKIVGIYSSPEKAKSDIGTHLPNEKLEWKSDDDKGRMQPVYYTHPSEDAIQFIWIRAHVLDDEFDTRIAFAMMCYFMHKDELEAIE